MAACAFRGAPFRLTGVSRVAEATRATDGTAIAPGRSPSPSPPEAKEGRWVLMDHALPDLPRFFLRTAALPSAVAAFRFFNLFLIKYFIILFI